MGKAECVNQELPEPEGTVENRLLSRIGKDLRDCSLISVQVPYTCQQRHLKDIIPTPALGLEERLRTFGKSSLTFPELRMLGTAAGLSPPLGGLT